MRKLLMVLPFAMILLVALVAAYPMCTETVSIGTNCSMVSNNLIGCSNFSYSIYNVTNGGLVTTGVLAQMTSGLYYFNLTVGQGDYVTRFCDNSTRQTKVTYGEDKGMLLGALILIPMILAIILVLAANYFNDPMGYSKLVMIIMSTLLFFLSMYFAVVSIGTVYGHNSELAVAISTAVWIVGIMLTFVYAVILITVMKESYASKQEKEEQD